MLGCWTLLPYQLTTLCNTSGCGREEKGENGMDYYYSAEPNRTYCTAAVRLTNTSRRSELTVMEQPRFKVGVLTLSVATVLK